MKIKQDFVTNSSSASMILIVKTKEDMTLDEFKEKFSQVINKYKKYCRPKDKGLFWDGTNIEQKSTEEFHVKEWTSMYNGYEDIPSYMKDLVLDAVVVEKEMHYGTEMARLGLIPKKIIIENDY